MTERTGAERPHPIASSLLRALEPMIQHASVEGVLLFGSCVTATTDSFSDIDVLLVGHDCESRSGYVDIGLEACIDYKLLSYATLASRAFSTSNSNNRSVLRGMVEGIILRDLTGALSRVQADAKALWLRGPGLPKRRELIKLKEDASRLFDNARRAAYRSQRGTLPEALARLKVDQMFVALVNRYYRVHGLWSSSIASGVSCRLLQTPELKTIADAFFSVESSIGRVSHLRELANLCRTDIENLSQ